MKETADRFGVATFHSTHAVMKAEKILKEGGIEKVRLIPVPSQVSSDCGVTVRFPLADMQRARDLLQVLAADLEGFYGQSDQGWEVLTVAP